MKNKKLIALGMSCILFLSGCGIFEKNDSKKDLNLPEESSTILVDNDDIEVDSGEVSNVNFDFSIYENEKTFTPNQISVQSEFENFLKEMFIEQMSLNSVSLHFAIENPRKYGIEDLEPSWGNLDFINFEDEIAKFNDILKKLKTFDYDSLTYEQQLIYDMLQQDLENDMISFENPLFLSAFSPISGAQSELPVIFSEYSFLEKEDIDDYITLLSTVNEYIDALCEYELERKKNGFSLSSASIKDVISQCEEFINTKPNCLRPVFNEQILDFGLSQEEADSYMKKFDEAMENVLIPGYNKIISTLKTIDSDNVAKLSISKYENGKDYYEYLVSANSGSYKSVDELYEVIEENLKEYIGEVSRIYVFNKNIDTDAQNFKYPTDDPEEMLKLLSKELEKFFPKAVTDNYTVNYVPESLENTFTPAFYLVPPIDNLNKNIIYINGADKYADSNIFPTIAHEGFPGHLYQTTYYYSLEPHYFRSLLSYSGYVEGWAHYIENEYSYEFAGMNDTLESYYRCNNLYGFAIYCMADIGINYYGWNYNKTKEFLSTYISPNDDVCKEIYYTLVDDPGVYLRYYVGYLEIMELRDEAMESLDKNFDIVEFHRFLLEIGPCQFNIISDRMEDWIDRASN